MKVRIVNESSFFHDMVGKIVPGTGSGVWVKMRVTRGGQKYRLWFGKGEVEEVKSK